MTLSLMNEKAISKVVRPQLAAAYAAQVEKDTVHQLVSIIACTNPLRLAAVPSITRQLTYAYGESEKNRAVALQLLTTVFGNEDY